MKEETVLVNMSGSAYLLIKPGHRRHIGISDNEFKKGNRWEMLTEDEEKTKGPFISAWKKGE